MNKLKRSLIFAIYLSLLITLAACGSSANEQAVKTSGEGSQEESSEIKSNLIIASSPSGSAYNSTAAGIASVVSKNSDIQVTLQPYEGPNAYIPMLNAGEVDFGFTNSIDVVWSITGGHGYQMENKNVRIVVMGNYPPTNGIVVREDSGIETTKDLVGKKVAYGFAGNQLIQLLVEQHLNSVGLTWDDVEKVPVTSSAEGMEALRDGRVDATMGLSPYSAATIETDAAVGGLRVLNLGDIPPEEFDQFPEEIAQSIAEAIPGTRPVVYENVGILEGKAATIYEYPVMLIGTALLNEDTVYEVVKTLFENYEELHPIYSWLESWTPETMFDPNPPAPYHEGAIKYFKEIGVWTEEAEQNHQELLKMVE